MKRKTFLCMFLMALLSGGTMYAETEQTVIINGTEIDKFVSNLTFNGNNVTLQFDDNTSLTEDMSKVSISLSNENTTGITNITSMDNSGKSKVYNLNGQYMGKDTNALNKGVYIINGKKTVIK
ncbi:subtilase [Xylanibacter rarus]|uniref:subtilase n=1 Tax=Xylanibacter rarus TaxID=1676614 RepID=UPI0035212911